MTAPLSPMDEKSSAGEPVEIRRESASDSEFVASLSPPSRKWAAAFSGGDKDSYLIALICAMLALGALAIYKIADAIGSACWACG